MADEAPPPHIAAQLASLQEADAILAPDILERLRDYVAAQGSPQAAVEALSSSYEGYPQVCNVLLDWMGLVGMEGGEELVVEHLKKGIVAKYDPKLTRNLFEATSTPGWVMFMISQPVWRELFYTLSERYPEDLLVNFAIRNISEDTANAGELSSLKKSAVHSFSVFARIMASHLTDLLAEPHPLVSPVWPEFVALTTQAENTFLFALVFLSSARKHYASLAATDDPVCSALLRFEEELVTGVPADRAPMFRKLTARLSGLLEYPSLASAMISMFQSEHPSTTPGDIIRIHKLFLENGASARDTSPPLDLVADADLVDLLITDCFVEPKAVSPKHRGKYLSVLALLGSGDYDAVPGLTATLRKLQKIVLAKPFGPKLDATVDELVMLAAQHPVAAAAVIAYAHAGLTFPSQYSTTSHDAAVYFSLFNSVAASTPSLAPKLLSVYEELLFVENPLGEDTEAEGFSRMVMDCISFLILVSYAEPVFSLVSSWSTKELVDKALIRHFLLNVLQMVSPPLEADFGIRLLNIMISNKFHDYVAPSLSASDTLATPGLSNLRTSLSGSRPVLSTGLKASPESLLSAELVDNLVALLVAIAGAALLGREQVAFVNAMFDIPLLAERAADLDLRLKFVGEKKRTVRLKFTS